MALNLICPGSVPNTMEVVGVLQGVCEPILTNLVKFTDDLLY